MSVATVFLRLHGPMQSWGTESKLHSKSVGDFPTRSAVIGLVCAAMGIDRENIEGLAPFHGLSYAVCEMNRGTVERDYQTLSGTVSVDGEPHKTVISPRWYRCDASYLAAFEGDVAFLDRVQQALHRPFWPLFLGRKSHIPSQPIAMSRGVWPGRIDTYFRSNRNALIRCLQQIKDANEMGGVGDETHFDNPLSFLPREFDTAFYRNHRVEVDPDVHTDYLSWDSKRKAKVTRV